MKHSKGKQLLTNEYHTLQILRNIKEDVSQPSIAKEVGFSVGKVNFILQALAEKGLVKSEKFIASNNKRKHSYLLTDDGVKEKMHLTAKFIERKKAEYEMLQSEFKADTEKWGGHTK